MTKEEKIKLKEEKKAAKAEKKALKNQLKEPAKEEKKPAKVEPAKAEPKKVETKPAKVEPAKTTSKAEEPVKKEQPLHKNYHVSKREDGKWAVKFATGEKVIKLFDTQAEAIAFAKEKAANQNGSITIHKVDGKMRKQNYKK